MQRYHNPRRRTNNWQVFCQQQAQNHQEKAIILEKCYRTYYFKGSELGKERKFNPVLKFTDIT